MNGYICTIAAVLIHFYDVIERFLRSEDNGVVENGVEMMGTAGGTTEITDGEAMTMTVILTGVISVTVSLGEFRRFTY